MKKKEEQKQQSKTKKQQQKTKLTIYQRHNRKTKPPTNHIPYSSSWSASPIGGLLASQLIVSCWLQLGIDIPYRKLIRKVYKAKIHILTKTNNNKKNKR